MAELMFSPHALEQLALALKRGNHTRSQTEALTVAYGHVRAVVKHFGIELPQQRPTVQQVGYWQTDHVGARTDLADYIGVVGAIRVVLEVDPIMQSSDHEDTLAVIRELLAEAPDMPHGDTSSMELLVRLLKDRRLKATVTAGPQQEPGT